MLETNNVFFLTKASCVLNETCMYCKQQIVGNQDVFIFTVPIKESME